MPWGQLYTLAFVYLGFVLLYVCTCMYLEISSTIHSFRNPSWNPYSSKICFVCSRGSVSASSLRNSQPQQDIFRLITESFQPASLRADWNAIDYKFSIVVGIITITHFRNCHVDVSLCSLRNSEPQQDASEKPRLWARKPTLLFCEDSPCNML